VRESRERREVEPAVRPTQLRVTPAMAAGVTDRSWEVSDLVALIEAEERGLRKSGVLRG
jgi:hypothetical protein